MKVLTATQKTSVRSVKTRGVITSIELQLLINKLIWYYDISIKMVLSYDPLREVVALE